MELDTNGELVYHSVVLPTLDHTYRVVHSFGYKKGTEHKWNSLVSCTKDMNMDTYVVSDTNHRDMPCIDECIDLGNLLCKKWMKFISSVCDVEKDRQNIKDHIQVCVSGIEKLHHTRYISSNEYQKTNHAYGHQICFLTWMYSVSCISNRVARTEPEFIEDWTMFTQQGSPIHPDMIEYVSILTCHSNHTVSYDNWLLHEWAHTFSPRHETFLKRFNWTQVPFLVHILSSTNDTILYTNHTNQQSIMNALDEWKMYYGSIMNIYKPTSFIPIFHQGRIENNMFHVDIEHVHCFIKVEYKDGSTRIRLDICIRQESLYSYDDIGYENMARVGSCGYKFKF